MQPPERWEASPRPSLEFRNSSVGQSSWPAGVGRGPRTVMRAAGLDSVVGPTPSSARAPLVVLGAGAPCLHEALNGVRSRHPRYFVSDSTRSSITTRSPGRASLNVQSAQNTFSIAGLSLFFGNAFIVCCTIATDADALPGEVRLDLLRVRQLRSFATSASRNCVARNVNASGAVPQFVQPKPKGRRYTACSWDWKVFQRDPMRGSCRQLFRRVPSWPVRGPSSFCNAG